MIFSFRLQDPIEKTSLQLWISFLLIENFQKLGSCDGKNIKFMLLCLLALIQVFDFLTLEAKLMAMKAFMEGSAADMLWDDPFDSIDDLLNFPNDDDVLAMADACRDGAPAAPPLAPTMICSGSCGGITGVLHGCPAPVSGVGINSEVDALGMCNDMDISNLEWLSNFFEDSEFNFDFAATTGLGCGTNNEEDSLFRSSSPISVLEPNSHNGGASAAAGCGAASSTTTSSSCSSSTSIGGGGRPAPPSTAVNALIVPARARTKRPRPPSFSARSFVPPPPSEYVATTTPAWPAEPESAGESCPVLMKRRKKKKAVPVMGLDEENSVAQAVAPVTQLRKCMHCQIHKTPQWRAGPMGPKTLCNACGVRYKSGRLFPEYRPAASPTFVPSFHSNSHRKVVEMRLRVTLTAAAAGGNDGALPMERTVAAKNCDLLEYIRRRD